MKLCFTENSCSSKRIINPLRSVGYYEYGYVSNTHLQKIQTTSVPLLLTRVESKEDSIAHQNKLEFVPGIPETRTESSASNNSFPMTVTTSPEMNGLAIPEEMKKKLSEFYKTGGNRRRQVAHGTEIPKKRFPQVIIVGAKKCGTSALKIFMNYHPKLNP